MPRFFKVTERSYKQEDWYPERKHYESQSYAEWIEEEYFRSYMMKKIKDNALSTLKDFKKIPE